MYKIRKVTFHEHPVLRNLSLDFCDSEGNAVDTVLIAGENGTGKSTILNELYKVASHNVNLELDVEFENDGRIFSISYNISSKFNQNHLIYANDSEGNVFTFSNNFRKRYEFSGIFSDVDINFHSQNVSSVTSLALDAKNDSRRSSSNLPTEINQLLIDIQALDDADVALAARQHSDSRFKDLKIAERMPRFTTAFNRMFDGLTYSHIENKGGYKSIIFCKNGINISIDALSSGEKQIVYRGCFLLKDANAINGAFVFIDEPEISLHPAWQMKIMDYYKSIFTDKSGIQTSQIFAVTHSPFVIHNESRKNDKVIVLARDENGQIIVQDKPKYFKCNSIEAVNDAFSIPGFLADKQTVYLEGRTDEKYFNKALEVFNYQVPFQFKWVGYINDEKKEEYTGKDALNKSAQFLIGRNLPIKNVCLFDCDTNKEKTIINNVYSFAIPKYENSKSMKKGIENALILESINLSSFYERKQKKGDYGNTNTIEEFNKMKCCDYICSLDVNQQKIIFSNLKSVIDELVTFFESN